MHLLLIKEFKYFSHFNFIAICTYIFNEELSMFEWQPKRCKCERTFGFDYIQDKNIYYTSKFAF